MALSTPTTRPMRQAPSRADRYEMEREAWKARPPPRSHTPRAPLIHRHVSRAAFLTTDVCVIHRRHCFRRRFTPTAQGAAQERRS